MVKHQATVETSATFIKKSNETKYGNVMDLRVEDVKKTIQTFVEYF